MRRKLGWMAMMRRGGGLTMKFPGWVEEVDFIHPQVGWRVEHVIAKWEMLR